VSRPSEPAPESPTIFDAVLQGVRPGQRLISLSPAAADGVSPLVESVTAVETALEWALDVAGTLRRQGAGPGDNILLIPRTTPQGAAAFLGSARLGCVTLCAPVRLLAEELATIAADAGARACLCADDYPHLNALTRLLPPGCRLYPLAAQGPPLGRAGGRAGGPSEWPRPTGDSVAAVLFTSGTSGRPKGVVLPHRAYVSNARRIGEHIRLTAADTFMQVAPMYYISGQVTALMASLIHGSDLVLCRWFEPRLVDRAIAGLPITVTNLVPTMISRVIDVAAPRRRQESGLRLCLTGGAPCPKSQRERLAELWGAPVVEGYGSTEGGCGICINPIDRPRPGSVGPPLPGYRVRVVDAHAPERPLPPGHTGELQVLGDTAMHGYYDDPEATAAAFIGPWLRTGDLASLDDDGYVYIRGRMGDVIKRGGEKLFAGELEGVIRRCPAVAETVVVGVPDPDLGERPVAFFTRVDGTRRTDDIAAWLARRLPRYRRPDLRPLENLPVTDSGKVARSRLRALEGAAAWPGT